MLAAEKLATWVKDPQMWISCIGVATLLGFCVGTFEPAEKVRSPQSVHWVQAAPSEELATVDLEQQNR